MTMVTCRSYYISLRVLTPAVPVGQAVGHAQPSAVPSTACCTAIDNMPHHLRAHPDIAARRTAGGALQARARTTSRTSPREPPFQRPPTSAPSTKRRCGPSAASSGYVARLRRSATRRAAPSAPSTSALHGCGCPARVSGDTRVASQHKCGRGSIPCLDAAGPGVPLRVRGSFWSPQPGRPAL